MKKIKFIKWLFLCAVLVFLIIYFRRNIEDIRNLDIHINWLMFGVSMLFYFLYKITLASLWHYITKLNNAAIDYWTAIRTYLYSILGKYIPGKVFMLAARVPGYQEKGIPMRKVTICFILENIGTMLGAAFLFLISLFFFPNELLKDYMGLTICLIIIFFICIHPKILNIVLGIAGKIMHKNDMVIEISYSKMVGTVLLFILNWLTVGIGFYILTYSIYPVPVNQMLYAGGIFALSAFIGIISIFAPSGIGVREGIIVAGLMLIMPNEYAVIISIISRLWATVAELLLVLVAFLTEKFGKRRGE